ncbi:MAG: glycoside hydrolase family 3 N-terminal domain-containing protein [Acidobacteriaceae bacterium]
MPLRSTCSRALAASVLSCVVAVAASAQLHLHKTPAASAAPASAHASAALSGKGLNDQVEALLGKMTLGEKIGQLSQYSVGTATGPGAGVGDFDTLVAKGATGSLFNVPGAAKVNHYQHIAMEKSRLHIPLLIGQDIIHGDHTTFPVPLALAASFDPELVRQTARQAATESRTDGVNWVFSPMVDIARDARWGRIVESAGEDPYLGSAMAAAYIHGYQGDSLTDPTSVAACVKHFAAYGAAIAGRDYNTTDMSQIMLRQVYLPPYKAAIDAGAVSVMSAFNALNGVPSSANPFLLTEVLRKDWGFDGLVVSDWGSVRELIAHSIAADGAGAAQKAVTAGVDMDMQSDLYRSRLPALVQNGQVPASVIDEAVRRILRVKFAMGLFEHPYAPENAPPYEATAEERALTRKAAEESFVLLKNDPVTGTGALLPLAKSAKTIALIGPLADSKEDMLGSWAGNGDPKDVVTLRAALQQRLGEKLIYAKGTDILSDSSAGYAEAEAAAQKSDLVILALGESGPGMTGEATSRAHLGLPGNQEQLLEILAASGKPVVLVLFDGRPIAIPWAAKHVPAILEAWFPGIEAGPALAATLFGESNPSGRLPVEFPYSVGQEPLYLAQLPTGRPAGDADLSHPPTGSEDKYLSRYIDSPNAPVFPFGWGLSYSRFSYSPLRIEHTGGSSQAVGQIRVTADVKNEGAGAGTEVVQLYLRDKVASVEQPVRELKGFQRVTLASGESKPVTFNLGFDDLAFYNVDLKRVVEPGTFDVWIGGSSQATDSGNFTVLQ